MRAIYGCRAKGGGRGGRVRWAKNFSDDGRNLWRPRARVPKKSKVRAAFLAFFLLGPDDQIEENVRLDRKHACAKRELCPVG